MSERGVHSIATFGWQKIVLIVAAILLALAFSEAIVRLSNLDIRLLRKTLYYQCAFLPLHKTSSNAKRLYETVPGAVLKGVREVHPKETRYRSMDVSINALGFRNREFPPVKRKGVFRIIFFGGSNTFGAAVGDEDTYPAQLQKLFDQKYPGRVEVWNAGICAYVISQDVAYAEEVTAAYDPDMIVFQDTNVGRRAFLFGASDADIKRLFAENGELYAENLPLLWQNAPPFMQRMHYAAAASSALYRVFCVASYHVRGTSRQNDPVNPITDRFSTFWYVYGQSVSDREFDSFISRHSNRPIALFYIDEHSRENNMPDISMRDNMRALALDQTDKPPEYGEIHPPSYVYNWYARELFRFITTNIDVVTTD